MAPFLFEEADGRIFAMDRIMMLHQTKEAFEIPEGFDFEEFMRLSFGAFQGEGVKVKIWFAPDVAGCIKEKIWHHTQEIVPQKDGAIILEAEVAGTEEIKFWVMSWGPKAEVLEPQSVRLSGILRQTGKPLVCWSDQDLPVIVGDLAEAFPFIGELNRRDSQDTLEFPQSL